MSSVTVKVLLRLRKGCEVGYCDLRVRVFAFSVRWHYQLEKTAVDRGRTDRISLTHDLENRDLQSFASYGHDLLTRKSSR